jgi:hypothetical protein
MAIVVVVLFALLGLMALGWRNRRRRQAGIAELAPTPAALGGIHGSFEGLYVATTIANEPINRVAVRGLGFRSKTTVTVADTGLAIAIPGVDPFIPLAAIRDVGRSTWTIDRVVETGGLIRVGWDLGDTAVDSYFRLREPEAFLSALAPLTTPTTGTQP